MLSLLAESLAFITPGMFGCPALMIIFINFPRHIAGPQVLGVSGQDYRVFRAEDEAVDYYADQLMRGKVTKVIAPPY
jgi:hypothetical protein